MGALPISGALGDSVAGLVHRLTASFPPLAQRTPRLRLLKEFPEFEDPTKESKLTLDKSVAIGYTIYTSQDQGRRSPDIARPTVHQSTGIHSSLGIGTNPQHPVI